MVVNKSLLRRLVELSCRLGYTCQKHGWGWAIFSPEGKSLTPVCHDEAGAWRSAASNESLILEILDWVDKHA